MTESFLIRALSASAYNVEDMSIQVVSIYLMLLDALLAKDNTTEIQPLGEPLVDYLERFKRVYDLQLYSQITSGSGHSFYPSYGTSYGSSSSRYGHEVTMTQRELLFSKVVPELYKM
mgnify:FL=1